MIGPASRDPRNCAPARKGWVVKISPDVDLKPIRPSHFKMAAILERMLRANPAAWPTNATLADRYGCTKGQVKKILRGMETDGFLTRVPIDPENPQSGRTGILANRRLDLDLPVADQPPSPEDVDRLKARRGGIKNDPGGGSKMTPRGGIKNDPPSNKESLSLKKDEPEEPEASLDQRQRKDKPILTPTPVAPPPEVPAAAPASPGAPTPAAEPLAAEALTPGQYGFLARLSPELRARFDALNPGKRAELLKPHETGFVADLFDFQIRTELKTVRPIRNAPPIPATMAELWEQLPGQPRAWSPSAAQLLTLDFGVQENSRLWGEFHKIAEEVRTGRIDPAHVINAHRQAMGPGIKNRGAKFWAAFQGLSGLKARDLKAMAAAP